ncbi:oligosaccharide repeat unit polymerase [Heliorestis acidaminivorans]|uniref:Oligosaccharide repeat unit polymerase n=1 Tax=Heliorestis acidaminivorans TaxID=553427 RepID=A0A6I0F8D2_9FIRM|nr:O-antigen polymerase [Heliorestis acidaminivorans]KAB2953758.1 oligosaccharide repeat unit polymerase [Heliorestis acidaminivorans]
MKLKRSSLLQFFVTLYIFIYIFLISYVPNSGTGYGLGSQFYKEGILLSFFLFLVLTFITFMQRKSVSINRHFLWFYLLIISYPFLVAFLDTNQWNSILVIIAMNLSLVFNFFLIKTYFNIDKKKYVEMIAQSIVYIGVLAVFIVFYVFFIGEISLGSFSLSYDPLYPRVSSWFGNPNRFGIFLALTNLFAIYLYLINKENVKTKARYLLFILLITIGLFWSGSKGAIFTFLCGLSTFYLVKKGIEINKNKNKKVLSGLTIFISFVVLIIIVSSYELNNNIFSYLESNIIRLRGIESGSGRIEIWSAGLQNINTSSFFQLIIGKGHDSFLHDTGRSSHNGYLRLLYEYGFLFIALFAFFLYFCLINIFKKNKGYERALLLSQFIMLLTYNVFSQNFFQLRFETIVLSFICSLLLFSGAKKTA